MNQNLKLKKGKMLKKSNGITLIALVITIVVLVILGGVLVSVTIENNGLFDRAKTGVSQYKISAAKEKLELGKAPLFRGPYTIEDYIEALVNSKTIDEVDAVKIEDHIYDVNVDGLVFRVTDDANNDGVPDGKITYTFLSEAKDMQPEVVITGISTTDTSIFVQTKIRYAESGQYEWYIKEATQEDSSYTKDGNIANASTHTFSGLNGNVIYKVKVVLKVSGKNDSSTEQNARTVVKVDANSVVLTPPANELTSTNVTVELPVVEGYTIKYTTDGSIPSMNSTTYTQPIIMQENGVIKYFYTDGSNYSSAGTVDITNIDKTEYTITYNGLEGATHTGAPATYKVDTETFTIPNPTKLKYTFTGWTGSNGNTPQTTVAIAKGSQGNKTYTANWSGPNYVDVTPPTAKTGLKWTGSSQALVNAGSSTNGTVQYSLDNSTWSTTIPTGTNVENYTVYYRVISNNQNYADRASTSIQVSIAKANLKDVVQVGDYVAYNATNNKSYTSVKGTGASHGNGSGSQTFTSSSSIKWRVLKVENNQVVLISEAPIGTFTLYGAIGYLYAEEEINRACAIYGYGTGADTTKQFTCKTGEELQGYSTVTLTGSGARSINVDDIDKICGITTVAQKQAIDNKYNTKPNTSSHYYPTKTTPDGISTSPATRSETYTYYAYQGSSKLTNTSGESYKMLFRNTANDANIKYWLASRCVSTISGYATFDARCVFGGRVDYGNVDYINLCFGGRVFLDESSNGYGLRPVVYLQSTLQTSGKTNNTWQIN